MGDCVIISCLLNVLDACLLNVVGLGLSCAASPGRLGDLVPRALPESLRRGIDGFARKVLGAPVALVSESLVDFVGDTLEVFLDRAESAVTMLAYTGLDTAVGCSARKLINLLAD